MSGISPRRVQLNFGSETVDFVYPPAGKMNEQGMIVATTPVPQALVLAAGRILGRNTHGRVAMHPEGLYPYIVARGPGDNPGAVPQELIPRPGHDLSSPSTALVRPSDVKLHDTGDPLGNGARQLTHPASGNFFEFLSIADLMTRLHPGWFVRLPTLEEMQKMVTCDGTFTSEQIEDIAHIKQPGMAVLTGQVAEGRRNPWGILDAYGNVAKWTLCTNSTCPLDLSRREPQPADLTHLIHRMLSGASFAYPRRSDSGGAIDLHGIAMPPDITSNHFFGAILVAEPR